MHEDSVGKQGKPQSQQVYGLLPGITRSAQRKAGRTVRIMSGTVVDELAQSIPSVELRTPHHKELIRDTWHQALCKHRSHREDFGPCPKNVAKPGSCSSPLSVRETYNNVGIVDDKDIMTLLRAGIDEKFVAAFTAADIYDVSLIVYIGDVVFSSKTTSTANMIREGSWFGLGDGQQVGVRGALLDELDYYLDAGMASSAGELATLLQSRLGADLCLYMREQGYSAQETLEFGAGLIEANESGHSFPYSALVAFIDEYTALRKMCTGVNGGAVVKIAAQDLTADAVAEVASMLSAGVQETFELFKLYGSSHIKNAVATGITDLDTLEELLALYGRGYASSRVTRTLCETLNRTGPELVALAKVDPFYGAGLGMYIELGSSFRLELKKLVKACAEHNIQQDLHLMRAGFVTESLSFFLNLLEGEDANDIAGLRNLAVALEISGLSAQDYRDTEGPMAGALRPVVRRWDELRDSLAESDPVAISTALNMASDRWEEGLNVSYTWFRNNLKLI